MKRIVSVLLSVVLVLGMIPTALAIGIDPKTTADNLYRLGLVSGTGVDAGGNPIYELDRAPTRSEAITVLVKLLGKADEAGRGGWEMPFTDVPGWARNFVGYAYANGLTAGTSATTFGGEDLVTASQYITFILKALGYSAANGDFQWDRAWELSDRLGITGGRYDGSTETFTRGDVFLISEAALKTNIKGSNQTLAEQLMAAGVFTKAQYDSIYNDEKRVLNAEEVYARCSPAVFFVEVYDASGRATATGSGFFIDPSGVAVTNYHVIEDSYSAKITTSDTQKTYKIAGIYDYSKEEDWAVVQVSGTGFSYLEIGDATTVVGGATVYAIGSPLGLQNSISQGLISNVSRVEDGVSYIQTSAPISSGSSGGALINKYGEVIGVTSATYVEGQNLNLALPMTIINGFSMEQMYSFEDVMGGYRPNQSTTPTTPSGSGANQAAAFDALKQFVLKNYNQTIGKDVAYRLRDGEFTYQLIYSAADNEISLRESFLGERDEYVSYIVLTPSGTSYYSSLFVYEGHNAETWSFVGWRGIDAATFHEESSVGFAEYEGEAPGDMETVIYLSNLMILDSLQVANAILNHSGYSVRQFGFTCF